MKLTIDPATIPQELRDLPQWVNWKAVRLEDGRITKVPMNPRTSRKASSSDPSTWCDFDTVFRGAERFTGIGFVVTADDPYTAIDLDHAVMDGELSSSAQAILRDLPSYAEVSPSGTGVHLWVRGRLPLDGAERKGGRRVAGVEFYDRGQYLTVTGQRIPDSPADIHDRQEELSALCLRVFEPKNRGGHGGNGTRPAIPATALPDDAELLDKAKRAGNGSGAKFTALYDRGDLSYHDGNHSSADQALCNMLAFWTANDAVWMERLFSSSQLGQRDKWRDRADYRAATITEAIARTTKTYDWSAHRGRTRTEDDAPVSVAPGEEIDGDGGMDTSEFEKTEGGNAKRLVYIHGNNLRYCKPQRSWYAWDGVRWALDDTGEPARRAKSVVLGLYAEAARTQDDAMWKHARRSDTSKAIAGMLSMAETEEGIPVRVDDLDRDPWLINTPTGTINLRTGELLDHRREDLITKVTSTGYDQAAECPTWLKFLERVLPDTGVRAFVQRAAGYSLTGSVSEQCLFFLHGAGANGKSTMLEALRYVIGDYGQQAAPDLLILKSGDNTPTGVAALRGARLICTVEVEEGRRLAESLTKQLTGGDRINARFLYQNAFEFDMTGKIWLAANHRPGIRGTDLAIWRRVRLVPFTESIPEEERDPELLDKLKAEAAGILRWCVEGCQEWRRIGLRPPDAVKAATEDYRVEQDVIGTFIADCCVTGKSHRVKAGDLFKAYQSWCTENGERPTNQTAFGRKLEERQYTKRKQGGTIYRDGIALAADTLQIGDTDPFGEEEQDS